ncbi:MAG: nicotinamide-nucleotide adenylyltransferase [Candidatus Bathyarchaeia archaeon]|nr:nicotinamide-nucleotide adenylyltransferase [Candidatus Bathyarchaeota archaeon]
MKKNDVLGVFIGRFQPFHLGHLEAVKYALTKVNQLIIVIGSAQYSHTLTNPFTAGERLVMIKLALKEAGISCDKYFIVPVEDVNMHGVWVAHLKSRLPNFDVAFSNEPVTSRLLKEAGIKVEKIPFFNRDVYSATEIRRRILKGENWMELVPKAVAQFIKEIKGDERIIELSKSDKI